MVKETTIKNKPKETPCFSFLVAGPEDNINNKKSIIL